MSNKRRGDYEDNDPKRHRQEPPPSYRGGPPGPPGTPAPPARYPPQQLKDKIVPVLSNFYKVELHGNPPVFQYHLTFTPPIESRRLRGGILRNLEKTIGDFIVADHQLFLFKKLPEGIDADVASKPRNGGEETTYHVNIAFVGLLSGIAEQYYCYNLLVKKLLRAKRLEQIGRAYFDPKRPIVISGRNGSINLWPGYKAALERTMAGIMLNVDLKYKVIRNESVLDIIKKSANRRDAEEQLVGKVVITRYNNKHYTIGYIDWNATPRSKTFTDKKTGKLMSVLDYTKLRYPEVKNLVEDQPLIVVSRTRLSTGHQGEEIYLIPQMCMLTGLTENMRSDFEMMKTFKMKTLVPPQQRLKELDALLAGFADPKLKEEAQLRSWNTYISKDPIQLFARVLEREPIFMKDKTGEEREVENNKGDWNMFFKQNLAFHTVTDDGKNHLNWAIIFPGDFQDVNKLVDTLNKVAAGAGITLLNPKFLNLDSTSADEYVGRLQSLHPSTHFVLCVLPTDNKERYNAIKGVYCSAQPVVSQCITRKTLGKSLMSVCTKLVLQIVAKIGGAPWVFRSKLNRRALIIGVDISHNKGKPSTVGLVASINSTVSKFYSRVYQNPETSHVVTQLGDFIKSSCIAFAQQNPSKTSAYPSTIIIYRDGLGESQMKNVVETELNAIEQKLKDGAVAYKEIVFVVVQKRIDARFFLLEGRGTVSNVESGTVVDNQVTANEDRLKEINMSYDFYLVGQSHMQGNNPAAGTMNPAHYWVRHKRVVDEPLTTPDELQRLTYKLCHLYYNWAGTVSAPALCKYAKTLATLAGKSLHGKEINPVLYTKMPYL